MSLHTEACAVKTAIALAGPGLSADVIGNVWADPFGAFLLQTLDERSIGAQRVSRDPDVGTSATTV